MQRRRSLPHTFEENIAAEKAKLETEVAKLKPGPQMDAVCTEKLNPRVVMVKSGQDGVRTYGTESLNRPRIRRIFV